MQCLVQHELEVTVSSKYHAEVRHRRGALSHEYTCLLDMHRALHLGGLSQSC